MYAWNYKRYKINGVLFAYMHQYKGYDDKYEHTNSRETSILGVVGKF